MFKKLRWWKKNLVDISARRALARRQRNLLRRLVLEPLEDRTLPSTVWIDSVLNAQEGLSAGHIRLIRDLTSGTLTVNYTIDSSGTTATNGVDFPYLAGTSYYSNFGNVTFPSGLATVDITVDPTGTYNDSNVEGNETVQINLLSGGCGCCGSGTYTLASPSTASLTISDDDNLSTTESLVSSANPSYPDQAITFTATVTNSSSGPTPTGTITFLDGGTTLGTGTLSGSGNQAQATFTTTSLALGSHTITADYGGDSNHSSNSANLTQTVSTIGTSETLTSSVNPSYPGQSLTFTATVTNSSTGPTPTGTITFLDGGTTLGTGTLSGSGNQAQATFTTTSLGLATHTITANYGGDSNHNSNTAYLAQTVAKLSPSETLASSLNPANPGQAVTFTATVSTTTGNPTPTGTVTFYDGGNSLGTTTLSGSGAQAQAALTTSSLSGGSHTITATYAGNTVFNSVSTTLTQTVSTLGTTETLTSSVNPSYPGQAITFTATVTNSSSGPTPTGTVTFRDGGTTLGTGMLSGSGNQAQATFTTTSLALGTHSITANYAGDSNHSSNSASLNQTVAKLSPSETVTSSLNPANPGQAVTFTATVSGTTGKPTPTGTVTFYDGGTSLGTGTLYGSGYQAQATLTTLSLSGGNHTITATYGGNNVYNSVSSTLTQTVGSWTTTATLVSSVNPSYPGQAITLTATVSSAAGTPTGTVTFSEGGTNLGTATLSPSGSQALAALTTSSLALGSHTLTATYSGDSTFNGTNTSLIQTVSKMDPSASLASSVNPSAPDQAVTFTATFLAPSGVGMTPTGTATFSEGSTTLGSATLSSSGQATLAFSFSALGSHNITAAYSGDSYFSSATITRVQSVNLAVTGTLISSVNPSAPGQAVTFTATVSSAGAGTPTGTVDFKDGSTDLGSVTLSGSGSQAHAALTIATLSQGAHNITAIYGGDDTFASISNTLSQTISPLSTSEALSSSALVSGPGEPVTFTATIFSPTGTITPTGTVDFSDGATHLATVTLAGSIGQAEATLTISTLVLGTHTITAAYSGDAVFEAATESLTQTVSLLPAYVSLSSSAPYSSPGSPITFTALISGGSADSTPAGTIDFSDGPTPLGTVTLFGSAGQAQATLTISTLSLGTHTIAAAYSGDSTFAAGSVSLEQYVSNPATSETTPINIVQPADQTTTQGSPVSLPIQASSTGGTLLFYVAVGLPPGLIIDPISGLISGTADVAGSFQTTVTVTDGAASASQNFHWTVNTPITITPPSPPTNNEGEAVSLSIQATNAASGTLIYSATGLPAGLNIDSLTGLIFGTIAAGASLGSPFSPTITATDGTYAGQDTFTWLVTGPVTVTNPGNQANREGDVVSLAIQASGPSGGTLTYSATGLPEGLAIDSQTGSISGTIAAGASALGAFFTTIRAADDTYAGFQTFSWNVSNPITITAPADQNNAEGDAVSLSLQAVDAAGGTLTFSATGLPDGLAIDPNTGTISGTLSPGATAFGPFIVTVSAGDGTYANDQNFHWSVTTTVTVVNPGDQSHSEGNAVSLQIQAADSTGSTLTYSAAGLPDGLVIDPVTGLVSGTIAPGAAGSYLATVMAGNGTAGAQQTFNWTVAGPIAVTNPGGQANPGGTAVSLQVQASDATSGTLRYSATGLPDGLSINRITGLISGIISASPSAQGNLVTTVTASNGTAQDQQTFHWQVTNPITLTNPGDQWHIGQDVVSLAIQGSDASGGTLTFSATGLPPGLTINPNTGLISGTITAAGPGSFAATVTAGNAAASARQTFSWNINPPINLGNPGNQAINTYGVVLVQIRALDHAGRALTFSAAGLPDGLTLNPNTGLISGTVSAGGFFQTTITADDGIASARQTFNWDISCPLALINPGDQGSLEGDAVSLALLAIDPAGAALTFSAAGLPDGLTLDSNSGVISGTLGTGPSADGLFAAVVTVTDGTFTNRQPFFWSIASPVAVTNPGDQTSTEGTDVSIQVQAADAHSGTLTYSASNLPAGLAIDSATGLISGTISPGGSVNSPFLTTVTASNGTNTSSQAFHWNVSSPIVVTSPGPRDNPEGEEVSLPIPASGPAGSTLTYSATGLPTGLSIDSATGLISGTIAAGAAATTPFLTTVTAGDGTYSASQSFQWKVVLPITVVNPGDQTNAVGNTVSLQIQATASGSGSLIFIASGLPDGLSINPHTGLIAGTILPAAAESGPFLTTVTISEPVTSASLTINWDIDNPVTLTDPGDQNGYEGDTVSLQIQAVNATGDPLTFSSDTLPDGLELDPATGLVSGMITAGAAFYAPFSITVTATDGTFSDQQSFTWDISSRVTLTNPNDQYNQAGDVVSLALQASDAAGATLTYSALGLPDGLTINPSTGLISGTLEVGGSFLTTVTAADDIASAQHTFTWNVTSAVALANPGDQVNHEGDTVSLSITATDANNATLIFAATGLPEGLSINPNTGLVSGTIATGIAAAGPLVATITASDGAASARVAFTWSINGPVTMDNLGDQAGTEGAEVSLQVQAEGPTGSPLTYSATGLPSGLTIDPATGVISGTIAAGTAGQGTFTSTITAASGAFSTQQTFRWNVSNPISLLNPGDQSSTEGDVVSLQVLASDSSGGVLSFTATGLPSGLTLSTAGLISGTIAAGAAATGVFAVTLSATNGAASAQQTFLWTVSSAPAANNSGNTSPTPPSAAYPGLMGPQAPRPPEFYPGTTAPSPDGILPANFLPYAGNPTAPSTTSSPLENPINPAQGTTITSGSYHRHYNFSGATNYSAAYLDVTIDSTFGSTVTAGPGSSTPGEQGTITYTAWLVAYGTLFFSDSQTVTFNSSIVSGSGYSFQAFSGPSGPAGYDLQAFGFDLLPWTKTHKDDTLTYSAQGNFRDNTGKQFFFSNRLDSDYHFDTTTTGEDVTVSANTEDPPPAGPHTIETTETYHGHYARENTISDLQGNLPTGSFQFNAQGYPVNSQGEPIAGTTFLHSFFDTQDFKGKSKETKVYDGSTNPPQTTFDSHNSFDGKQAYRYFFKATTTFGNRNNSANPNEDRVTETRNLQWTTTYGGGSDSNFSGNGSGYQTIKWNNQGTIAVDSYDNRDVYHYQENQLQTDGVIHYTADNNGQPTTFKNSETFHRVYDGSGLLKTNRLDFSYKSSVSTKITTNDSGDFTFTVLGQNKTRIGQSTGWYSQGDTTTGSVDALSRGTKYLGFFNLPVGGFLDQVIHLGNTGSSQSLFLDRYNSNDGSISSQAFSHSIDSGSTRGWSTVFGDYNALGQQISGYRANESSTLVWGLGFSSSRLEKKDDPVKTTITFSGYNSNGEVNSFLNFNPDGTANGNLNGTSYSFIDLDLAITWKGWFKIPDGDGNADDTDNRHLINEVSSNFDLVLISDNPTGTITNENQVTFTFDSTTDQILVRKGGTLYAQVDRTDEGSTTTQDRVTIFLDNLTKAGNRQFIFTQTGEGNFTLTAKGRLFDNLGHTGSWTYKETAEAKANDSLTLDFVWVDQTQGNWGQGGNQSPGWKETGRSFSFDHYTKSITEFFQSDNGWVNGNDSDAVPSTTGTKSHVLSVDTFAERKIVLKGTPKDYSFTINQNYADSKSEMRTHDWSITIAGESGRTKSYTENTLAVLENHTGINKNGIVTESNFESVRYLENFLKFNTHIETPNTIWDTTKRRYSEMFLRREGNPQNWNGFATFKGESVDYWERIDKIKGKKTSYLSPPNYYEITRYLYSSDFPNATTSPDFWNIYLEDIKNSSPFPKVVQWVIQNWDNLQRIGVGLLDVAGGITLTLDSCGLGIIPGVGLMVVGLDQIVTGVANWGSEIKAPSVFEYLGYSGAKTLGFSEGTSQVIGSITPAALSLAFSGLGAYLTACFAAGTQLLTPEGSKAIEEFKVGDLLLSRNENWFEGPVVAKVVEEVFVRTAQIMELRVGGRVIKTTGAHPFYVAGKGWQAAEILEVGEELSTHNGWWMKVEEIHHSGKYEPVYNLRVADFHTYFVGAREWGFSVWAHNQCMPSARFTHNEYVQRVRPGARERTFYPGGRNSRGLGSRRYDDFDHVTRTAFEGNTTPWSQMTAEKLQAKLHQVGSDILLLNDPKRAVRRVIWFGTEPLPTSGLGGQLLQALQQAGIPYWFVP